MRRDRLSNEKIPLFLEPVQLTAGTHLTGYRDFMELYAGTSMRHSNPTNMILQFAMGHWGAGGTVTVTVQDSDYAAVFRNFATLGVMSQGALPAEDLWLAEIRDFRRYLRLSIVVAVAAVYICVMGNAERSRREPVAQWGTEVTVTYLASG